MSIQTIITRDVNPVITLDTQTGEIFSAGISVGVPCSITWPQNSIDNVVTQLTASQIQNMKATPVVVLPAGPSGYIRFPLIGTFEYSPVATDYTIGNSTQLVIGSDLNPLSTNTLSAIPATILSGANGPGNVIAVLPSLNALIGGQAVFAGRNYVITHDGSTEYTLGDGLVTVKVYFISITF